MSNRRASSLPWLLPLVLPLALAVPPVAFAQAETPTEMSEIEPVTETPVEVADTDGGVDAGGTDSGNPADASPDTGGPDTGANPDAPQTDGGSSSDDEGDCGCRLGGAGRGGSATLPLAGTLAGLGLVWRRRARKQVRNSARKHVQPPV